MNFIPLWVCPDCEQSYVTNNKSHSCVIFGEEEFFNNKDKKLFQLYKDFVTLIESIGPFTINFSQSRISFQDQVKFAGIARVTKSSLVCQLWMKKQIFHKRFTQIEFIPPNNYVYQFHLRSSQELDSNVKIWLKEAYKAGKKDINIPH